jgi:L-ascorbate metabolism protein UlaG (beta-lactamase superfamily)
MHVSHELPVVQFVGHATVYIELDGLRLLTDPILRERSAGLVHRHPPPPAVAQRQVDVVLISHLHHDHLDMGSLRMLPPGFDMLAGPGGGHFLAQHGFPDTRELLPGDDQVLDGVTIRATRADHRGYRVPAGPDGEAIGFLIEGSIRIYFAGDTDVFDDMRALQPIDLALLPIAGWGPRLGPGHMNAARAVEALKLLQPRVVIPIHWGTLAPWGMHYGEWSYLTRPAREFEALARRELPNLDVRVLQPGESTTVDVVSNR